MGKYSKIIEETGILPVINITEVEVAKPLCQILLEEGIQSIEVTLRSECSLEAIAEIKKNFPEMIVGAGTVLDIETIDKVLAAGADYIVTPGFDEGMVEYCIKNDIEIFPGCSTATEIQKAYKMGLRVLKFFPAELSGGVDALKRLSGPFKGVKFVPTGGINYSNLGKYLSCNVVAACGGSYMATSEQLKNRDFEGIRLSCRKAMDISLGFELAHVGINHNNEDEANATAKELGSLFRMPVKMGNSSTFAGDAVECMKMNFYGKKGHIGFKTSSSLRALAWLRRQGYEVIKESIKMKPNGTVLAAYLEKEIGGFAVHIMEK